MYARSAYAPRAYRRVLSQRIAPLIQRWGLAAQHDDDYSSERTTASGAGAGDSAGVTGQAAPAQPALF
jgi:hypothetical protein